MSERLRRAWQHRGAPARLLWPLSQLYGALVRLRHAIYACRWLRSERLPVPVIVVGNVVAGGSGKTPVTIALAQHLRARGWHPGVISRGWGRATQDCRAVLPASSARDVGDEPLLIARRAQVPVYVAPRRADAHHRRVRRRRLPFSARWPTMPSVPTAMRWRWAASSASRCMRWRALPNQRLSLPCCARRA